MSTGKRLAKRSIIGTRVCAPGDDGKYYSGVIHAVKTPASAQSDSGLSITPKTRYSVRFDQVPVGDSLPPSPTTEYSDRDLIGPGFGSVTAARLVPGQKVFLTYNGREIQAEVTQHREHLDEVDVVIVAPSGQEGSMRLTKRIDEVRLLESRKSARLADSDTDFARLADVGSDRKRASSHSIEVPQIIGGSRKRRPSTGNDWSEIKSQMESRGDYMDECSAAMVLMSLSTSPKNGLLPMIHCQQYGSWQDGSNTLGRSNMIGSSNSSNSSSASWRSDTPSPPLCEDSSHPVNSWPNHINNNNNSSNNNNNNNNNNVTNHNNNNTQRHNHNYHQHHQINDIAHQTHNQQQQQHHQHQHHTYASSASNSPNFRPYDEGYISSYINDQDRPRKKKLRCKIETEDYPMSSPSGSSNSENEIPIDIKEEKPKLIYQCSWRNTSDKVLCGQLRASHQLIEDHVRQAHLGEHRAIGEEDFYIQELPIEALSSPPTKSHWDMVKPISEDPEYQKQMRHDVQLNHHHQHHHNNHHHQQQQQHHHVSQQTHHQAYHARHHTYTFGPVHQQQQHSITKKPAVRTLNNGTAGRANGINLVTVTLTKMNGSPRRVRGETKKCRKVYGMDHRELWCTQCKWKKACSRFGDHA